MKTIEKPLNIIEFIRHPLVLNDQTMSSGQSAFLKTFYGLELSEPEMEIYCRGTGRQIYAASEQREVTLVAGRRAGKTGKLAAPIALFEAFRDHGIPRGERGHVMLIAPS